MARPFETALLLSVLAAGCATHPMVPDNLYDEPPPRAPVGAEAGEVFTRPPWELRTMGTAKVRYLREAKLQLPDSAASFDLREVAVYAEDGSDVQVVYAFSPPGGPDQDRVVVRVSVYRATSDLEGEWQWFARRWHQRQSGSLTEPLPLPAQYPADAKRMAWTLPVGDGYDAPALEEIVLFRSGGWFVRYNIACPAAERAAVTPRIVAFLGSLWPA